MKTNVTIRIDADVVRNARELNLNISRICESALLQAVEEEREPFVITETSQIILQAELIYNIRDKRLAIVFNVINASEENVLSDRIYYLVSITDKEFLTDLPVQGIQEFTGIILERRTISKGGTEFFSEQLIPSSELAKRLSEVTHKDSKNLRWVAFPTLIVDSKKRVLKGKYEQKWDEKGLFPIPQPLKTM